MKLSVYSLKKVLFQGTAISINCKTEAGEITLLDKHEPLVTILSKGVMKILDAEKKLRYIDIKSGFLEVKPGNEVRCIVD